MRRTYSYLATQNMLKIVLMTMFLSPKTTNSSNYWQTNVHAVKAVKQQHHSTSSRCPCANANLACGEQCHCRLCDNSNGRKFKTLAKFKPCRCGENCQIAGQRFCISSQCNCRKFGHSCTESPICQCKKCDNEAGSKIDTDCPPKKRQATERLELLQKSAGKLPDMNSVQFFKRTGQAIKQSIWSQKENLLLMSLIDYVQLTERHVLVKTVANLYNSYVDRLSQVRRKTTYQILYKIRHLNNNRNVCNY